jgi:hypothetical protein
VELQETLKKLCSVHDPSATVVSLALDLAKTDPPQLEARGYHRNRMLDRLGSDEHPAPVREILRGVSGKMSQYIETEMRPETEGLFLVAGPGIWQPFELGVAIKDFLHVGRTPYIAPLLEALSRMPRAYVLRFDQQEGILEEVWMGVRREIERVPSAVVERDAQHQMSGHSARSQAGSGRSATRMGGGGRDRFEHCVEDSVEAMLHKAADKVLSLQQKAPSESIYAFGDRKHFPYFRDRLPATLRSQAIHVGPVPHRHEELLAKSITEQQDSRVRNRIDEEVLEFQARLAEQCHVASGPEAILPLLDTGKVARVFLDPAEPMMGTKCGACAGRAGPDREKCEACGNSLAAMSMTQEVVSHALLHPPLPLTFVSPGAAWLKESGGMAALLSEKGIHTRRQSGG